MKKCLIPLLLALTIGIAAGSYFAHRTTPCSKSYAINETLCSLRRIMDRLWVEHMRLSSQLIISTVANLGDIDAVTKELLNNQDDIGAAFAPYYGQKTGNQLAQLLREHIAIAADIFTATVAQDEAAVAVFNEAWYKNASEIAQFLNSINPKNWEVATLNKSLNDHLKGATQDLLLRINQDWKAWIANADRSFDGAQEMGAYCAQGIAQQFPEKVRS